MGPDEIRQIAAWLAATDIGLLELRGPAQTLRLRNDGVNVEVDEGDTLAAEAESTTTDDTLTVSAPSLGVFLLRHPLRQDDLIAPGTTVTAGQALGLLQTGPLLLPVRSPADAAVQDVLVAHGTVVGFGTPLVALLPSSAS